VVLVVSIAERMPIRVWEFAKCDGDVEAVRLKVTSEIINCDAVPSWVGEAVRERAEIDLEAVRSFVAVCEAEAVAVRDMAAVDLEAVRSPDGDCEAVASTDCDAVGTAAAKV
jgi:hypothetical protein